MDRGQLRIPRSGSESAAPVKGTQVSRATGPRAEDEPDARFTLANERTFLAWNRTALALIATGVAATQLLPKLEVAWGRRLLGLPLIALGAIVAAESFRHWRANERAMQTGEPLPARRCRSSSLPASSLLALSARCSPLSELVEATCPVLLSQQVGASPGNVQLWPGTGQGSP